MGIDLLAPKKKPGRKPADDSPKDRHIKPRKAFHAEKSLFDALAEYRESKRPRPDESEIMRTALEQFLEREGFWPPDAGASR